MRQHPYLRAGKPLPTGRGSFFLSKQNHPFLQNYKNNYTNLQRSACSRHSQQRQERISPQRYTHIFSHPPPQQKLYNKKDMGRLRRPRMQQKNYGFHSVKSKDYSNAERKKTYGTLHDTHLRSEICQMAQLHGQHHAAARQPAMDKQSPCRHSE